MELNLTLEQSRGMKIEGQFCECRSRREAHTTLSSKRRAGGIDRGSCGTVTAVSKHVLPQPVEQLDLKIGLALIIKMS